MAALTPADLIIKPFGLGGRLDPRVLWPDDDHEAGFDPNESTGRLSSYLEDAAIRIISKAIPDVALPDFPVSGNQNAYARWWSYYRAFAEKYDDMVMTPAQRAAEGEGSSSYTDAQIERMAALRDEALAVVTEIEEAVESEGAVALPITRQSANAISQVRW